MIAWLIIKLMEWWDDVCPVLPGYYSDLDRRDGLS